VTDNTTCTGSEAGAVEATQGFLQEGDGAAQLVGGHWSAKQVALQDIALVQAQEIDLLMGLDALGQDFHVKLLRHGDGIAVAQPDGQSNGNQSGKKYQQQEDEVQSPVRSEFLVLARVRVRSSAVSSRRKPSHTKAAPAVRTNRSRVFRGPDLMQCRH